MDGKNFQDLAPRLYDLLPKRRINKRTVKDALTDDKWLEDIQGEISLVPLLDYLELWDVLEEVQLQQEGTPDKHLWRFSSTGIYTAKSAYDALFQGAIVLHLMSLYGNPGAP